MVFFVGFELAFDQGRSREHVGEFIYREVGELQKVFHAVSAKKLLITGTKIETISSASASVMINGGTKRTIVAGYHGYIYVDRDLGFVAKIAMECDSIPVDFPVQTVKLDLDYDFTKIGTQDFVLPLKTSLKSREGKYLSWNEAEFRLYKKFGTETTVTFEPLEPLSEDATKEQPPVPDTKK